MKRHIVFGKMKMRFAAVLLLAGLGTFAAACAQPPVPQDQFYRLQVSTDAVSRAAPLLDGVLEVERLLADGITAGRPLVYSVSGTENQLQEYNYHFWTEPPTVMLQGQLIKYLRANKIAKSIVTPEMRVRANYILGGKIHRLEKVVGVSPRVVLEIELALREARSEKLVYLNSYTVEKEADSDSISAAVKALNDALSGIYGQFVDELGQK